LQAFCPSFYRIHNSVKDVGIHNEVRGQIMTILKKVNNNLYHNN
jgi:hypothetical protein